MVVHVTDKPRLCATPLVNRFMDSSTMRRFRRRWEIAAAIITSIVSASSAMAAPCLLPATRTHTVTAVVDARTLQLDDGTALRLASILAPTSYDSPAAPAALSAQASAIAALSKQVLGRNLAISLERTSRDRYGRRVGSGLLIDDDGNPKGAIEDRWLQARAVRAGAARVALTPAIDMACAALLLRLEAAAAADKRGLWQLALYNIRRASEPTHLLRYRSTFQIVEGTIARVAPSRHAVYLNFGENWKRDFTAKFDRAALKRVNVAINTLKQLEKRAVRIRGWIEKRNGPLITIWRPEQIELLHRTPTGDIVRFSPPRLLTELEARQ